MPILLRDLPSTPRSHADRRALEREGYRVIEAIDGAEGLTMLAEHGHTLSTVVTDMMMPGMSGRAFAMAVGASNPELGIVCISGYMEAGRSDGPLLDTNHVFLQSRLLESRFWRRSHAWNEPAAAWCRMRVRPQ